MSGVKLMNRVDTKFLTTLPVLSELLRKASNDFFIQDCNGLRNMRYYTRYFDTDDTKMYIDHQRGKKSRRKVRIRQYLDSDLLPFLEIKEKNNKGRTKKIVFPSRLTKIFLNMVNLYPPIQNSV